MKVGKIIKVSGPLVVAEGIPEAKMFDVVRVSEHKLIGEIIEIRDDLASIQVYEETTGLGPGEPVYSTGLPLSVELGPGLIESIYDGIQRPLNAIAAKVGDRITRGIEVNALPRDKKWHFTPKLTEGTMVSPGDILGVVQETVPVEHRIMVPPGISGRLIEIKSGSFTVEETIARVETSEGIKDLTMLQRWPVAGVHTGKLGPQENQRPTAIDTLPVQRRDRRYSCPFGSEQWSNTSCRGPM